jgi:hypothetical protein
MGYVFNDTSSVLKKIFGCAKTVSACLRKNKKLKLTRTVLISKGKVKRKKRRSG